MRGAHAARALLLMVSCGACHWASAGQDVGSFVHAGKPKAIAAQALAELEPATMPGGMASLCRRDPRFCAPAAGAPGPIVLSEERWQLLEAVNGGVNHSIASTTDRKLYGTDEYWAIPTTAGDCEDYVLLKRQMLMKLGLPEALLLITVVHDENGEGHAVLTIPSSEGDLVLDNRRDEILHWWQTGYSFIKRQSEHDPDRWVALGHESRPTVEIASGPALP